MSEAPFSERLAKHRAYYDRFAQETAARTESRDYSIQLDAFCKWLEPGARVLDLGCGTGIHLKLLKARGLVAFGVEPSAQMRQAAQNEGFEVLDGSFEQLTGLDLPRIDGVWAAASLLHVPLADLPRALNAVSDRLLPGSPFFVTVRLGADAGWDRYDDDLGEAERLIQLFEPESLKQALVAAGFELVYEQIETSYWGRSCDWINLVALKQ